MEMNHASGIFFAVLALSAWTALSFCIRMALRGAPLLRTTATVSTFNAILIIPFALLIMPLSAFRPAQSETLFFIVALGLFIVAT